VEEQQAPHETNEQYEERVMNKRANQLYHTIKMRFSQKDTLVFDDLTYRNRRKEVILLNEKKLKLYFHIIVTSVNRVFIHSRNNVYMFKAP